MTIPPEPSFATVIGAGEIGRWLAGAMLHAGATVRPVLRHHAASDHLKSHTVGTPMVVAVPEAALAATLQAVPVHLAADALLVQNGTFPADLPPAFTDTVGWCVVWTLRRRGETPVTGQPTAISGPHGPWLAQALNGIGEPARVLQTPTEVRHELACKFAFILAINGVGLSHDGPLGDALATRAAELREAVEECLALTLHMSGSQTDEPGPLVDRALAAMQNMHSMRIRSGAAVARLNRARGYAQANALPCSWLQRVST